MDPTYILSATTTSSPPTLTDSYLSGPSLSFLPSPIVPLITLYAPLLRSRWLILYKDSGTWKCYRYYQPEVIEVENVKEVPASTNNNAWDDDDGDWGDSSSSGDDVDLESMLNTVESATLIPSNSTKTDKGTCRSSSITVLPLKQGTQYIHLETYTYTPIPPQKKTTDTRAEAALLKYLETMEAEDENDKKEFEVVKRGLELKGGESDSEEDEEEVRDCFRAQAIRWNAPRWEYF